MSNLGALTGESSILILSLLPHRKVPTVTTLGDFKMVMLLADPKSVPEPEAMGELTAWIEPGVPTLITRPVKGLLSMSILDWEPSTRMPFFESSGESRMVRRPGAWTEIRPEAVKFNPSILMSVAATAVIEDPEMVELLMAWEVLDDKST
jgi:hypothetical protein